MYDIATGTAQLASVNAAGVAADIVRAQPSTATVTRRDRQSPTASFVGFLSPADNLAPGIRRDADNLYVRDLAAARPSSSAPTWRGPAAGRRLLGLRIRVYRFRLQCRRQHRGLRQRPVRPRRRARLTPTSNVFVVPLAHAPDHRHDQRPSLRRCQRQRPARPRRDRPGRLDGLPRHRRAPATSPTGDPTATTERQRVSYTFTGLAPGTLHRGRDRSGGLHANRSPAPGTASVVVGAGRRTGPSFGDMPLTPDLAVQSINVPVSAQPGRPRARCPTP